MKYKRTISVIVFIMAALIILNIKTIGEIFYPFNYSEYIYKYSIKYNLNPYVVAAIIKAESNFNVRARSSKNAYGLMQITESTAQWAADSMRINNFNTENLYDPEFNIEMGCWYLNDLMKEFNGNIDLVLAAYNGGRGNVQKWLKDVRHSKDGENLHYIPYKETDVYVKRVKVNYNIYKFLYQRK